MTDITHEGRNTFFWGLLLLTVGAVWTAYNLGLIQANLWRFWPLLLVLVGFWIVLNRTAAKG